MSEDDLLKYAEALDMNLKQLLAISEFRTSIKEYCSSINVPLSEKTESKLKETADLAKQIYQRLSDVQDDLIESSSIASFSMQEGVHKSYLPEDMIEAETSKSFLIRFPRQVTGTKENSIWISRQYASRMDDQVEVRFYPLFRFSLKYYEQEGDHFMEKSSRMIDAITFMEYCNTVNVLDKPELKQEKSVLPHL